MKQIVRLTESDLSRIVSKILSESSSAKNFNRGTLENVYKMYNNLGSSGTFDQIFKSKREGNIIPYNMMVNGCATKVSLALNAIGQKIDPPKSGTYGTTFKVTDGPAKGQFVNVNAAKLRDELLSKWGRPTVQINGVKSLDQVQNAIGPNVSGVYICAPCGFQGASGHATIWTWWKNGGKGGELDDTSYPYENGGNIYFWQVGGNNEETAKKCGYKNWDEYKNAKFKCKTEI